MGTGGGNRPTCTTISQRAELPKSYLRVLNSQHSEWSTVSPITLRRDEGDEDELQFVRGCSYCDVTPVSNQNISKLGASAALISDRASV